MSLVRETVEQLLVERGLQVSTPEIMNQAIAISTRDSNCRRVNKLQPRKSRFNIRDFIYDIECYPNFFSIAIKSVYTAESRLFEISQWKNQGVELYQLLTTLASRDARMIGFNNVGFDYPLLHVLMQCHGIINFPALHSKCQALIFGDTFEHMIWDNQRLIEQIDLFKIHHFDNKAKSTSLKMIEFNMRSDNIQELPFDPLKPVTRKQADFLINYNHHDVSETEKLYFCSVPLINFRESISKKYNRNFMNHNDTKIGKDYFAMELEKAGIPVKNVRTTRDAIHVRDILLPFISFETPEFNTILEFFRESTINPLKLKEAFKNVNCTINGFQFDFGAGGLHASLNDTIIRESDTHELIDVDVESYYPRLAMTQRFFPLHLTDKFCDVYLMLFKMRKEAKTEMKLYDKSDSRYKELDGIQGMIKLALNGVYGDSANEYSQCFYDPQYTMQITINGQLLLCMLAEQLMKIPDLIMVQCNTDGITFKCPKPYVAHAKSLYRWWENMTGLVLEDVNYSMMAISHVNSYLAVYKDGGGIKRIGAYRYETAKENLATRELGWHSDQSAVVIAKCAESALVHGTPIPEFIRNHADEFDFMLRTKVPRSSKLELRTKRYWGDYYLTTTTETVQNITRYYASTDGGNLVKIMPYTPKQLEAYRVGNFWVHVDTGELDVKAVGKKPKSGKFHFQDVPPDSSMRTPPPREIGINVGQTVTNTSNIENFNRETLDCEFYIKETRKIVDPLLLNKEI